MTLAIMPVYMREPSDLEVTLTAARSVHDTADDVELLLIDDCSPVTALVDELEGHSAQLKFELWRNPENEGFAITVNRGLERARDTGEDAVLLNADIEILTLGWDRIMAEQDAGVVGAMLLYPGGGLIQHAGCFFSFLTRVFDHRFRYAPVTLPEANVAWCGPVTGAMQFIRHECLIDVGLYDPEFRMAFEDMDYCIRVFESGRRCLYIPQVRAIHHESLFRGRADQKLTDWQKKSLARLNIKHKDTGMARWVPELV